MALIFAATQKTVISMSGGRGEAVHILLLCAPALFFRQVVEQISVNVTGANLKLNLEMVFLNKIDPRKIKELNISKDKLKAWYSILYKATLYSLYYKRPHSLDGYTILNRFCEHLKTIKKRFK